MPARKVVYAEGQTVYICGRHVLRGWKGVVLGRGNSFGSYYVQVKGKRWMVHGKNIMDTPPHSSKEYPKEGLDDE